MSGPRPATCIATINKSEGVTALVIDGVVPRGPFDGNYELAIKGEPTSRWKKIATDGLASPNPCAPFKVVNGSVFGESAG